MKPMMWMALVPILASCNTPPFNVVSVKPIYGWVDGCNEVKVSGSGFAGDATVAFGGVEVPVGTRGEGMDEGYWLTAVMPAASTGASGYVDVTVNSGGASDTVPGAYYYVACPVLGNIEVVDPAEGLSAGTNVSVWGCGLDATQLRVKLVDPTGATPASEPVALTADCSTAQTHFAAPTMPAGTYDVLLVDSTETTVYPPDYGCVPDSATACYPVFTVTYGGAK